MPHCSKWGGGLGQGRSTEVLYTQIPAGRLAAAIF